MQMRKTIAGIIRFAASNPFVWGLVFILLAYWQIVSLQYSFKFDMVDSYLPYRYLVGESLQNKIFPFWNPYIQCGYPIYADLMSTWSPLVLGIGLFGYNMVAIHFSMVFFMFVAYAGIYQIAISLGFDRKTAFLAGIVYVCSGFFVGHQAHINFIASAAWLPWLFFFYNSLLKQFQIRAFIIFLLVLYLNVTSGYPGLTIIGAYAMVAILIYRLWKTNSKHIYIHILFMHVGFIVFAFLFFSPMILAFVQAQPYIERFSVLTDANLLYGSLKPASFLSLLAPFAVTKNPEIYGDMALNSSYFGLIPLSIVIVGLLYCRRNQMWLFFSLVILFALLAMGQVFPFRLLMADYIPLMDKFKYPSIFRLFSIMGSVVVFLYAFRAFQQAYHKMKAYRLILGFLILLVLIITLYGYFFHFMNFISDSRGKGFSTIIRNFFFHPELDFQGFIQAFLLFMLLFFSYRLPGTSFVRILPLFIVLELFLSTQLTSYMTGHNGVSAITIQNTIKKHPRGFPLPDLQNNVSENKQNHWSEVGLVRNTSIYEKEHSFERYNPFVFDNYRELLTSPVLRETAINNPLFYTVNNVLPLSDTSKAELYQKPIVFVSDKEQNLPGSYGSADSLVITDYSPISSKLLIRSKDTLFVNFLQSHFNGWNAFLNKEEIPVYQTNLLFMGVKIPPGQHELSFIYENKLLLVLQSISLFIFIVFIFIWLYFYVRKSMAVMFSAFLLVLVSLYVLQPTRQQISGEERSALRKHIVDNRNMKIPLFYLTDQEYIFQKDFLEHSSLFSIRKLYDQENQLMREKCDSFYLAVINQVLPDTMYAAITKHYLLRDEIVSTQSSHVALYALKKR